MAINGHLNDMVSRIIEEQAFRYEAKEIIRALYETDNLLMENSFKTRKTKKRKPKGPLKLFNENSYYIKKDQYGKDI
jgi:hypothetical protein